MPFQIFEANRGWDWQLTFRIQRELRELGDSRWAGKCPEEVEYRGGSTLEHVDNHSACPDNSLPAPRASGPLQQQLRDVPNLELGANCKLYILYNMYIVRSIYGICAVHIVHFYVGFVHHLCKLDCNSLRRGRAPFEHLVLHKGQCCQWWHSEVCRTNKIVQTAKCTSVQVCK